MPKIAPELSAARVAKLSAPGLHAVGGVSGLHLQVTATGARSWILRASIGDKRRDVGLGSYPSVSLAEARERAREARKMIWAGIDPVADRAAKKAALIAVQSVPTFDECARRFLADKGAEFRNPKHRAQWQTTLETYASPIIGRMPVDTIGMGHVLRVLEQPLEGSTLWAQRTETASRLRGRIESVLAWATAHKHRSGDNPAVWKGNLSAVLAKRSKIAPVEHHAALPFAEVPAFVVELRQRDGIASRALEFAILTTTRSGEVRGATWSEIDLDAGTWTIPSERMKAGKEHRVPLSPVALALLKKLPRMGEHVFSAPRGGTLSDATLGKILKLMGRDVTAHGFRSSFRDWAGETTAFPREVIEHALAHQLRDKAEASYARGTLFDKRRLLMTAWSTYCATPAPKAASVTPINRRAKR